jgi:hypothetical protein
MHIRLEGTQQEIDLAIEKIRKTFTVNRVSKLYPNRRTNNIAHMRCYLDVVVTHTTQVVDKEPSPYDVVLGGQ